MSSCRARKIIYILIPIALVTGCAGSPFQDRTIAGHDGEERTYEFAYGNYCGPGFPDLSGPKDSLIDFWPPKDDLDAICYAHDSCYEITYRDDIVCDSALHKLLIAHQTEFQQKGCWNLTTDMSVVFFAKYWGEGDNEAETAAHGIVRTTLGIPTLLFWGTLKLPLRPFLSHPEEGTCNVKDSVRPGQIIEKFEHEYRHSRLNDEKTPILIHMPNRN